jgi:DNA-binding protein H-NS
MTTNGKLSDKQVTAWFGELNFAQQMSLLDSLSSIYDGAKSARISELKREIATLEKREAKVTMPLKANGSAVKSAVKAKYRNPATGESWSGRGRMAGWLASKKKTGEKISKYLVK